MNANLRQTINMKLRSVLLVTVLARALAADKPGSLDSCVYGQTYPADTHVWDGTLPGDVSVATTNYYGYAATKPPPCLHGAEVVAAWTQTNSFVRNFIFMYRIVQVLGEPKHGLWRWHVPGVANDAPQIWWCEMGGLNYEGAGTSKGHDDQAGMQSGMDDFWRLVKNRPAANQYGPLAKAAKLDTITVTAARVHLNHAAGAKLWINRGTSAAPSWHYVDASCQDCDFEVYATEAYYAFPDMFSVTPCPDDPAKRSKGCALKHSFIVAVVKPSCIKDAPGLPSFGLHYAIDSKCPEICGDKPCQCDALLIDIVVAGALTDALEDPLTYLPEWADASQELTELHDPKCSPNWAGGVNPLSILLMSLGGVLTLSGVALLATACYAKRHHATSATGTKSGGGGDVVMTSAATPTDRA